MAWVWLALASVFEVIFALSMKMSDGFTRPVPTAVVFVAAGLGLWLLALALRELPVSIAYPVWTSVGVLGTVIFGAVMLGEAVTPLKLASAGLIILGVAGLKVASG